MFLQVLCVFAITGVTNAADKLVGGYILMERQGSDGKPIGLKAMAALAAKADSIPVNRVWVAFFSPDMVYKSGSNTLKNTGLHISDGADGGFAELKKYIGLLKAGGVETFLSMGGWNYNCWPYMYQGIVLVDMAQQLLIIGKFNSLVKVILIIAKKIICGVTLVNPLAKRQLLKVLLFSQKLELVLVTKRLSNMFRLMLVVPHQYGIQILSLVNHTRILKLVPLLLSLEMVVMLTKEEIHMRILFS
jgi:hypothetical protein